MNSQMRNPSMEQHRTRLETRLAAALQRTESLRARVVHDCHLVEQAATAVSGRFRDDLEQLRRERIRHARQGTWRSAISLRAITGNGHWLRITLWLALVFLLPWLVAHAAGQPFSLPAWLRHQINPLNWLRPTLHNGVMWGTYLLCILLGRWLLGLHRTQRFRAALKALAALQPRLMHFSARASGDDEYPYLVTHAPWPQQPLTTPWMVPAEFGQLYDSDWISLHRDEDSARPCLLLKLTTQSTHAQIIPVEVEEDQKLFWPEWVPLLQALSPALLPLAGTPIRQLAAAEAELWNEQRNTAELTRRIENIDEEIADWNSLAIGDDTLGQILKLVDAFAAGATPSPKGILLYGPPGTGKTLIARKLAEHSGCSFTAVGIADLKGQHIGHTGPQVKAIWQRSRQNAPCLLFVDECESVFIRRGSVDSDAFAAELVQTFLAEWDGFAQNNGKVLVIGATNRRDLIDDAIMSRFTSSIEIGLPDGEGRKRILAREFRQAGVNAGIGGAIIEQTAGLSGRDLHTLVARVVADCNGSLSFADLLSNTVQQLRRKQSTQVQPLDWDDIALPTRTREEFLNLGKELRSAEKLRQLDIPVPRGILLYGPPGTGKTQIARILANQSGLSFIAAATADLKGGHIGHSGQRVKSLFERARAHAPCILFIDEIDIVAPARGEAAGSDAFTQEIIGQLLQELDGVARQDGQVFLLAASNHPGNVEPALLSRMERKIEIALPDIDARIAIIHRQLRLKPTDFDLAGATEWLAVRTEGLSGRDLGSLVTLASRRAVKRALDEHDDAALTRIRHDDLQYALEQIRPHAGQP
ncbi:MAG: AAA family ATPase [Xanthomonadaceae bacterium]|jgi:transitional endoplasmic reticulum ATPase|nr:AAA family ATPase [Xanthomonadaceae bacterium]